LRPRARYRRPMHGVSRSSRRSEAMPAEAVATFGPLDR
jgi:hypothetical protein